MGELFDDVLPWLIGLIWLLVPILRKIAQKKRQAAASPPPGIDPRLDPAASSSENKASKSSSQDKNRRLVAQQVGRLAGTKQRADQLDKQLQTLTTRLQNAGPASEVLVRVARDEVGPRIERARQELDQLDAQLGDLPAPVLQALLARPEVQTPMQQLARAEMELGVLRTMADWRQDPQLGPMLADADALAESLLKPMQRFSQVQNVEIPAQRPICAPAEDGMESLWLGLLPAGYPVIFVPDDYGEDLFRHASVAHEVGHLLWFQVPGLAQEMHRITGLPSNNRSLLGWDGRRVQGSMQQPFGDWLPELVADAITLLMLGPAGLRGLVHSFAAPDDPDSACFAHPHPEGGYDEHPPPHLRVHLGARFLHRVGYDQEVKPIIEQWDRIHGAPDALVLPVSGRQLISAGLDQMLEFGSQVLEQLYTAEYRSLDGFTLQSVPGLEMSPGLWARVKRRATDLVEDTPFHDDARVVLAAAMEARAAHPGKVRTIQRGLRRAILGRDADERRVADPNYSPRRRRSSTFADEVRDAILLREALQPRRRRGF